MCCLFGSASPYARGGAHHLDFMWSHPDDPAAVIHARAVERELIADWIAEKRARVAAAVPGGGGSSTRKSDTSSAKTTKLKRRRGNDASGDGEFLNEKARRALRS